MFTTHQTVRRQHDCDINILGRSCSKSSKVHPPSCTLLGLGVEFVPRDLLHNPKSRKIFKVRMNFIQNSLLRLLWIFRRTGTLFRQIRKFPQLFRYCSDLGNSGIRQIVRNSMLTGRWWEGRTLINLCGKNNVRNCDLFQSYFSALFKGIFLACVVKLQTWSRQVITIDPFKSIFKNRKNRNRFNRFKSI